MRSYGLTYRGKDEGRWEGNHPAHYCSCCYSETEGYIQFGRNTQLKRKLKRGIKRRARQEAKNYIRQQLEEQLNEPEDQP